jgi:hypothetical protein
MLLRGVDGEVIQMRRISVALAVVMAATTFGWVPAAWARRPHRTVRWEAVAAASVSQLSAKGFTGFSVEHERRGGTEVEREFATKKAARAEVDALRAKGFGARLERS